MGIRRELKEKEQEKGLLKIKSELMLLRMREKNLKKALR